MIIIFSDSGHWMGCILSKICRWMSYYWILWGEPIADIYRRQNYIAHQTVFAKNASSFERVKAKPHFYLYLLMPVYSFFQYIHVVKFKLRLIVTICRSIYFNIIAYIYKIDDTMLFTSSFVHYFLHRNKEVWKKSGWNK